MMAHQIVDIHLLYFCAGEKYKSYEFFKNMLHSSNNTAQFLCNVYVSNDGA